MSCFEVLGVFLFRAEGFFCSLDGLDPDLDWIRIRIGTVFCLKCWIRIRIK
jgi:hypothetical protein